MMGHGFRERVFPLPGGPRMSGPARTAPPDRPETLALELASPEATRRAGRAMGAALPREAIVLCAGEMGAGKTTLIKAVCEGLGIARETVISPTYTLVNVYAGRWPVHHVDLYRLDSPEALLDLDRADWVNPAGPTLIEWPELAEPLLAGEPVLRVHLAWVPGHPERRGLRLSGVPVRYGAVLAALRGWAGASAE